MNDSTPIEYLNEHILEIRYKPNARILDCRGRLAESIANHMSVSEWRIGVNRVDAYNSDQLTRYFVSFRNAGAVIRNTSSPDYFANQARRFVRHVVSANFLRSPVTVERLGVRSRFAIASSMSFEALLDQYRTRVLTLTPAAEEVFSAKLIDIGAPVNFETEIGRINSNGGPMEKAQLAPFFDFVEEQILPEVSLYVEFDYWVKPSSEMTARDIAALVKSYAQENWQRHDRISTLVLGE